MQEIGPAYLDRPPFQPSCLGCPRFSLPCPLITVPSPPSRRTTCGGEVVAAQVCPRFSLSALLLLLTALPVLAHSCTVAIAVSVEEIVVDGGLPD